MTTPSRRFALSPFAPFAVLAAAAGGCASRPAAPQPAPGAAAVVLAVKAEPRAGAAKQPAFVRVPVYDAAPGGGGGAYANPAPRARKSASAYAPGAASESAAPSPAASQYERIDYAKLGDIIVWLAPADPATDPAADSAASTSLAPSRSPLLVAVDAARPSDVVQPASVGQEVVFRNAGTAPVSLYSVSEGNDFDAGEVAPGAEWRQTIAAEGLIELLVDPGRPPVALVYAAPSPWVARARSGETVTFDDVTPGAYRAMSWHPRLPGSSSEVRLAPDQVTRATLAVGVKDLPTVP
jgi:hypothetical protein